VALLAGFLDVVLRGVGLVAFSVCIGGVAFVALVLNPHSREPLPPRRARTRALRLISLGAVTLALTQFVVVAMKLTTLAGPDGAWPLTDFLRTQFGTASAVRIGSSLALAAIAARFGSGYELSPRVRLALLIPALALVVNGAWLSHAAGRVETDTVLVLADVVHRAAAATWAGGLVHLLAFWTTWRGHAHSSRVLSRFSRLAMVAVPTFIAAGVALVLRYVDSFGGLVGTAFGVMVLSKIVLVGLGLALGALSFSMVRRARALSMAPPGRVQWLIEAEIGVGITILLAAASLSSVPPTVDVIADRVEPSMVATRFVPRIPRLTSPPIEELLAIATPISKPDAPRQPVEYAWSEYNHHTAGAYVVTMGALAFAARAGVRSARHWPLLLLGLGAFMFVRNDPEAWPLGPVGFWETFLFPDVLQHRASVLIVVGLGIFEWLVRTDRVRSPRWKLMFPLLCAAGAALLITHSHGTANVKASFLIEVSHTPLGILGVLVAWGRWLEVRLPEPDCRIPGRVWPAAMTLLGVFLMFYREEPPS